MNMFGTTSSAGCPRNRFLFAAWLSELCDLVKVYSCLGDSLGQMDKRPIKGAREKSPSCSFIHRQRRVGEVRVIKRCHHTSVVKTWEHIYIYVCVCTYGVYGPFGFKWYIYIYWKGEAHDLQ